MRAIQEAGDKKIVSRRVRISGWVSYVREQKQFSFIDLNDGSSLAGLKVVVDGSSPSYAVLQTMSTGCWSSPPSARSFQASAPAKWSKCAPNPSSSPTHPIATTSYD